MSKYSYPKKNGRPTDALKHKFQRILEESDSYKRLGRILKNTKDDDLFLRALVISLERGYGRPMQEVKSIDDLGNYVPFQIFMPAQISGQPGTIG